MNGFSIIICCYNGSIKIGKAVEYLKHLKITNFNFEIIIVDNNSSDNTYEVVLDLAQKSDRIKITVLKEPLSGKPNALIAGIRQACYEYVVVCDDDNWLDKEYIKVAYEIMEQNKCIGVLGGRGVIHTEGKLPQWFPLLENAWALGKQENFSGEVTNNPAAVWGAGMVIRKEAWDLLFSMGFKKFLTGRKLESLSMTGEDIELCILVKALGYKIYYEDTMWYQHDIPANRLTWKNLKNLWEGFSRSQVYFNMYEHLLKDSPKAMLNYKSIWRKEFKSNFSAFLSGAASPNFYKSLYIAFIEDREGYLYGLEKRKYLVRLKELWRIRKNYGSYYKTLSHIKFSPDEKNS